MKFTAPKPQEVSADPTPRNRTLLYVIGGAIALVVLLAIVMIASDTSRRDSAALSDIDVRGARGLRGSDEHLLRAMSTLEHIEEYQQGPAISQIMSQLGQWIADQPPLDEWSADPLIHSLPPLYARMADAQRPAAMEFTIQDYYSLSEAVWARNVSRWQVEQKSRERAAGQRQLDQLEDQLQSLQSAGGETEKMAEVQAQLARLKEQLEPAWLAAVRTKHGDRAADDLATAERLFDWTIRNVQLDPTNWNATLPDLAEESSAAGEAPRLAPPPGAELHAWQSLLLGRGDAANRARIFVLLARQQGLDAVVLGLKNQAVAGEPRPWAVGVLLEEELYLFDTELGLPLPAPGGEGIATLRQLREKPEILRQLDLDDAKYAVAADDLANLVALIDATPQALSQRMLLVEKKLPREHQLVLAVEPSALGRKLRKLGIDESRIWVAPYRAFHYDQLRQRNREAHSNLENELAVYAGPLPLFPARMLHFRGQFTAEPPEMGAKAYYLACRKPDRELAASALRKELIASKAELEKSPELLDALVVQAQLLANQAKRQATYWLGLVAYEDGDYGTAIDFLAERTLKGDPGGPWTAGARYNLARVHEATGRLDEAIALYEADDSPQRHGNRLRARRLRGT